MHFCAVCKNMYYLQLTEQDPNKLEYYCKHCGHLDTELSSNSLNITDTTRKPKNVEFSNFINKYTKLDPTLPRENMTLCPNKDCSTNAKENQTPREILHIRYDEVNMKYFNLCSTCDSTWSLSS